MHCSYIELHYHDTLGEDEWWGDINWTISCGLSVIRLTQ